MTRWDYLDVAVRTAAVALVVYPVVRFGIKPPIRYWVRRDGIVTRGELELYRWACRGSAPLLGALLGLHPDLIPELPVLWSVIAATIGGSLSIVVHHAVEAALPAAIARVLTGGGLLPPLQGAPAPPQPPPTFADADTLTTEDVAPAEMPREWRE